MNEMALPYSITIVNQYARKIEAGNYDKLQQNEKDEILADYLTIVELHDKVREHKMSKDEFFAAVDDILCF